MCRCLKGTAEKKFVQCVWVNWLVRVGRLMGLLVIRGLSKASCVVYLVSGGLR